MQTAIHEPARSSDPPRLLASTAATQAPAAMPVLDSAQLLRGARSVTIRHNGALYRLQLTRQGKLILTK